MALSEFELIRSYFSHTGIHRDDVVLGVGDDCALLQPPWGYQLAVSIDTLVEGVHFFPGTDPEALGHKALAVNLSDLAAMGAKPAWVTLALTLPQSDPLWLEGFCRGFGKLAERFGVTLIGGDTTSGPLNISVQVHGFVEEGKALRRDGAKPGDHVYVTGSVGDAGLALAIAQGRYTMGGDNAGVMARLNRPEPRVAAGLVLGGIAAAAIDISDGLLSDLGHICTASGVAGVIEIDRVPVSDAVGNYLEKEGDWSLPLASGDDYELCLTVSADKLDAFECAAADCQVALTRVGTIEEGKGVRAISNSGDQVILTRAGYQHFSG